MVSKEMREEIGAFAYELWKNGWTENARDELIIEYKLTPAEVDAIFEMFKEFEEEKSQRMKRIVSNFGFLQYDHEARHGNQEAAAAAKEKICKAVDDFRDDKISLIDALIAIQEAVE